jgi:cell wall-associated NlpC family hydrolase
MGVALASLSRSSTAVQSLHRLCVALFVLPLAACSTRSSDRGTVVQTGRPFPAPTATSSAAVVLPTADRYVGVKYTWGGESPKTGFDCSGYTQYVFARHGVRIPRTSRAQVAAGSGVPVRLEALQPGDLIMFAERGRPISHVAIYAGNRRIIHSTKSGGGVRYDNLNTRRGAWYVNHMVAVRRVGAGHQGGRIVRDLVKELKASGIRVDFPLDLGDMAPRPRKSGG